MCSQRGTRHRGTTICTDDKCYVILLERARGLYNLDYVMDGTKITI